MNQLPTPFAVTQVSFPKTLSALVLAPHPDDFDAIGMTLRFLRDNGNPLFVAVATSGASGVEDRLCSPPTTEKKVALREEEQRRSCRFFGLAEDALTFLRLAEDATGHFQEGAVNADRVRELLVAKRPHIVFLPHGNDSNLCHQRLYAMVRELAPALGFPLVAFYNEDPKTIALRCDAYLPFGEDDAAWKGELLRFHCSQDQRNLNTRGFGMDERILGVNRESAKRHGVRGPYAEVFELEVFGAEDFQEVLASAES